MLAVPGFLSNLLALATAALLVLKNSNEASAFVIPSSSSSSSYLSSSKDVISHQGGRHPSIGMMAVNPSSLIEQERPETQMMGGARSTNSNNAVLLSNPESLEELYPDFPRTWIPLGSTTELNPDRPNPVQFLGQSYVTYYNNITQNWVVMDETCPHRLAPLSEGRVEPLTRQLQCSYHGWTFDSKDGSCVRIPQMAMDSPAFQSAVSNNNPRSCVSSYTTNTDPITGIVWIWPWKQDPLQFAGTENDQWRFPEGMIKNIVGLDPVGRPNTTEIVTYTRDQPYGWDTLVENLIDPAHIPFAHHGMQGKRDDAIPINMTMLSNKSGQGEAGFAFQWEDRTMGQLRKGMGEFLAPFIVNYDAKFQPPITAAASSDGEDDNEEEQEKKEGRPFRFAVLCIPTKPGWSRVIVFNVKQSADASKDGDEAASAVSTQASTKEGVVAAKVDKKKKKKKKKGGNLMATLFKIIPTWVSHLLSNKFFDSDLAFLHYQEQVRRPKNNNNAVVISRGDARYFMPAECDRSISALHSWIGKYAKSYVQQQSLRLPPAIYDRKQLFNHWIQHTANCKICLKALDGIKRWKRRSQWTLAISIVLGFRHWPARVLAVGCLGAMKLMSKIERAFYEGEFKHYENH